LQNVLDVWPGLLVTTGHDRRAISRALLTTGDTGANEAEALLGKVSAASVGVGEMRVPSINDDVTWFCATLRDDGLDEVVDSLAGLEVFDEHRKADPSRAHYLDKKHHPPWLLELRDKLL